MQSAHVSLLYAFCPRLIPAQRAAIAQQLTNCLTEILFDRALARARHLDHIQETTGSTVGPLHGIPISLKDSVQVSGVDASVGFSALCFKPSTTTTPLATLLTRAGAVFYVKTNVPQMQMSFDSENPVWGRTLNPLNLRVTAGGSSGGESALAAMHGTILGVGTDIGGSIRVPAMCAGVYGLKPSARRIPYSGLVSGAPPGADKLGIEASAGPLARSVRDCELFIKTILDLQPQRLDPDTLTARWHELDHSPSRTSYTARKTLLFGLLATDGNMPPLPPIARLLQETAAALRAAGHTVVDIPAPPSLARLQSLTNAMLGPAGNAAQLQLMAQHGETPMGWLRDRTRAAPAKPAAAIAELHALRAAVQLELRDTLWRHPATGQEVDALICPVAAHPVPPIDRFVGLGWTGSFVFLDYVAGTVPVRAFEERDMLGDVAGAPVSRSDAEVRKLWANLDRSVYLGTPLCVQVLAPRGEERRCTRGMRAVSEAFGKVEKVARHAEARL